MLLNPLKSKKCLFYIRTRCVPRSKLSPRRLYKTNLLIEEKIAVCSEICKKKAI